MSRSNRPQAVIRFERLYLAGVGVWLVAAGLKLSTASQSGGINLPFVMLALALIMAINWFFWFFIARRGSNIVRWLFCVAIVFSLVSLPDVWANDLQGGLACAILSLLVVILQTAALLMLCGKDANLWLSHKGRIPESMSDVFG